MLVMSELVQEEAFGVDSFPAALFVDGAQAVGPLLPSCLGSQELFDIGVCGGGCEIEQCVETGRIAAPVRLHRASNITILRREPRSRRQPPVDEGWRRDAEDALACSMR